MTTTALHAPAQQSMPRCWHRAPSVRQVDNPCPAIVRPGANAPAAALRHHRHHMSAEIIVSYDGTQNDEDAVALGNLLTATGARLALAYVRHAHEWDSGREVIAQHDAELRL